jgi:hypothetical protein
MSIGEFCNRDVVITQKDSSVQDTTSATLWSSRSVMTGAFPSAS